MEEMHCSVLHVYEYGTRYEFMRRRYITINAHAMYVILSIFFSAFFFPFLFAYCCWIVNECSVFCVNACTIYMRVCIKYRNLLPIWTKTACMMYMWCIIIITSPYRDLLQARCVWACVYVQSHTHNTYGNEPCVLASVTCSYENIYCVAAVKKADNLFCFVFAFFFCTAINDLKQ